MAREKKPLPDLVDVFGRPITVGSKVAVCKANMLRICNVVKLNPKMLRVVPVNGSYPKLGFLVFPQQSVVVDGEDVLAYILSGKQG